MSPGVRLLDDALTCEVHEDALVRLAGFPFDWLLKLPTLKPDEALGAAEAREKEARAAALAAVRGISFDRLARDERRLLLRLQRAIASERAPTPEAMASLRHARPELTPALENLERALEERRRQASSLAAAHDQRLLECRELLRQAVSAPEFQEAVFLQSPTALIGIEHLAKTPPSATDSQTRQRETLATMFLQRLCAKNDTNSFFGPTARLDWTAPASEGFGLRLQTLSRRVYLSHWIVLALGRELAEERLVDLSRPWTNPTLRAGTEGYRWQSIEEAGPLMLARRYSRAHLPDEVRTIVEEHRLGEQAPPPLARDEAAMLAKRGLVAGVPYAIPSGEFQPELALEHDLLGLTPSPERDQALALVARLGEWRQQFARGDLSERKAALAALEAAMGTVLKRTRRGEGEHYADRLAIHEECGAEIHGTPLSAAVRRDVEAALPSLAALGYLGVWPDRLRLQSWFSKRAGRGGRMPLLEVEHAIDRELSQGAADLPALATIERIRAGVARLLERAMESAGPQAPAHVDLADLRSQLAEVDFSGVDALYQSVDLMIGRPARAERFGLISEIHGILGAQTFLYDALPERDAMLARRRESLARLIPRGRAAEIVMMHAGKTDARHPLGEVDIEIGGRSSRPRHETVAHSEIDVFQDDAGILRLASPRGELVPLLTTFYYPLIPWVSPVPPAQNDARGRYFWDALLPASLAGGRCPRLVLGGLVIRRASWKVAGPELADVLAKRQGLFTRIESFRRRLNLPRFVYLSSPTEPKPVFVDFESPLFAEVLRRMAGRLPNGTTATITEMLPGPDELFLEGPRGRHTFELRLSTFCHPRARLAVERQGAATPSHP